MTRAPGSDLDRVLSPVGLQGFVERYWGREPLHIARGDPGFYRGVLDFRELDTLLRYARIGSQEMRVESKERGKAFAALATVDRPAGERHLGPHLPALRHAYDAGDSIIVRLRRISPPVDRLCRSVEEVFHRRGSAELFLTPRRSQAFELHFDLHDVFLLQLDGAKTWQVYAPVADDPSPLTVDVHDRHCAARVGAPLAVYEVRQGDLLYIPLGFPHQGITGDESSLHVTIGVAPVYAHDLAKALVETAVRDHPALRRRLRGAFADRAAAGVDAALVAECLAAIASDDLVDRALARIEEGFIAELEALPDGQIEEIDRIGDLTGDSTVEWHDGQICTVRGGARAAVIAFAGGRIEGPPWLEPQLRWIATTPRFRVRDMPGDFSLESRLVLVRRLIKEGLLRRARAAGDDPS